MKERPLNPSTIPVAHARLVQIRKWLGDGDWLLIQIIVIEEK
jgi:hypothetical protein